MKISIKPISIDYLDGFREVFDSVAKERRFLAYVSAPPIDLIESYVRKNIENKHPQFIAVSGEQVIGWCDTTPSEKEGFRHTGYLGIGVQMEYRGNGIGRALLHNTIISSFSGGISRIELDVFASNKSAIALYNNFGFLTEGRKRNGRIIDGVAEDIILMSLLKEDAGRLCSITPPSCLSFSE